MPVNCPAPLHLLLLAGGNIPLQAEHHSGRRVNLFAFNGMLFAFTAESRSPSTGFPNNVHLLGSWCKSLDFAH